MHNLSLLFTKKKFETTSDKEIELICLHAHCLAVKLQLRYT